MMKIYIDGFGSDNPSLVIRGCAKAIQEIPNVKIVLVGKQNEIKKVLENEQIDNSRLEVIDAPEIITNNDIPTTAIRTKKDSSLVVALKKYKEDSEANCFISAGSTGAVIVGSCLILGRKEGVERPTLATLLPGENGKISLLADCGANVDCTSHQLFTFAHLASEYITKAFEVENPKVALLSVGTEDKKGNAVTKEAFSLLKESNLNFVGNMEAKTILSGEIDVIVSDGFSGNIVLKTIEGVAKTCLNTLGGLIYKNVVSQDKMKPIFHSFKQFGEIYDFNSLGGALLLGVNKPVIKTHGSSNEMTIVNVVKQAMQLK